MASFTLEISGLDELKKAFVKAPEIVAKETNDAIKRAILLLLAKARMLAPVDRGFLRGAGMQTSFGNLEGKLENTAPYALFVHEGTRPHFPPISAIAPWAEKHGIPAFLVARKIAQRGTQGTPFLKDALSDSASDIDSFFSKALTNIISKLAQ